MRTMMGIVLTMVSVFLIYQNRFRIISYFISIRFMRRMITTVAMNIPLIKDKFFKMAFSRSA
ncbi:hypothetical protein [Salirhabdus sp. Marseille-P4669]|uniref:hypothetical protein n=1 Tax=Salirhabdus sp. Marseille-P4669 TaxID=2042310 RepID=UPI000C7DA740|nr:hypothetical protein [Salirhabdus sp. Marseille-P4669]